ncbi:MAG TPA: hypothetical protein GXZ74_07785 [Tissierellia bacterium]|nr:hypothetical protein [Tissierellia bacterium]
MNKEEKNFPNDIEELGQVLETVSEKIPALIKGVVSSFYTADAGRDMGKAIGEFYQQLIAAGIPERDALDMAKRYMINLKSVANMAQTHNSDADKA